MNGLVRRGLTFCIPALFAASLFGAEPAAEDLIAQLAAGHFDKAFEKFDARMAAAVPIDKLEQTWKSIESQAGPFEKVLGVRSESMGGFKAVYVACRFAQATVDAKVVIGASGQVAGLFFGPHVEPGPVENAPSSVLEEAAEVAGLPATLTLPKTAGPFPALLLVHGSGPHDRDESIGANKPFRDLAWGLARNGVAVLRYEKRTQAHPEQFSNGAFTAKEEVIDDASAAVKLLEHDARISRKGIFVLGHSMGGMLIPRIAAAAPQAAGFVILAGNIIPLDQLLLEQMESHTGPNLARAKQELARIPTLKPGDPPLLGAPASYWIDLRGYQPAQAAREMKQPLLILQGERDYQVPMKEFAGWKRALAGHSNATFKAYPDLNHLFIAGAGKIDPAEYEQPGHVSETVIADIAAWIKAATPGVSAPAGPAPPRPAAKDDGGRAH